MMKWLKIFKRKPIIELILDDAGFYIIRAYGHFLVSTITGDKDKAEIIYNELKQKSASEFYDIIKEDTIK